MSATRLFATASLAALSLAGCMVAAPPTKQELALVDQGTKPILPADAAARALADKQDMLTQAKFWGEEYEKNPSEYVASLKFARALRGIGSSSRATEVASQALTLKPGDVDLSIVYAKAALDQGKPQDAAMMLAHAEGEGQGNWELMSIIGVTMDSLDQHTPAQDYYRKALALSPDNPKILSNLALSYALEGKPGLAEQTLRQAMAEPGADNRIMQNLVLVLGVQGKFDEAEKIAGTELPKAMIDSSREYFRAMLNPSRTWETVRGSKN